MKRKRFDSGGKTDAKDQEPPKKGFLSSIRLFDTPGSGQPSDKGRRQSLPDDTVLRSAPPPQQPLIQGLPGRQAAENLSTALSRQTGEGMKKGGLPKKPGGAGAGAAAALKGMLGGAGGPGAGAPMGGPPMGGPPPGPPPGAGGGMPPPPGMKRGGHVKKMNEGGQPHEDMPKRQANRKAKEFPADGGATHEEKSDQKGDFKYAKGGRVAHHGPHGDDETFQKGSKFGGSHGHGSSVHGGQKQGLRDLAHAHHDLPHKAGGLKMFAKGGVVEKGRALDKPDGPTAKEEKATSKGEMRYAKGGHVTGFRSSAHGIESKGKTKGKYC